MPCLWGQHNGSQIFCAIKIIPAAAAAPFSRTLHDLSLAAPIVQALIDTGATLTGITSRLADLLELEPVGKIPIYGVGGVQHHNSHLFMVAFPFSPPPGSLIASGLPPPSPGQAQTDIHLLNRVIQGCKFQVGSASFDVILGMDVLSAGTLVVQGNGQWSFSM
jgi:hypothetical protein